MMLLHFLLVLSLHAPPPYAHLETMDVNMATGTGTGTTMPSGASPSVIAPEVFLKSDSELDDAIDYTPPAKPTLSLEPEPLQSGWEKMAALIAGSMMLLFWALWRRRRSITAS